MSPTLPAVPWSLQPPRSRDVSRSGAISVLLAAFALSACGGDGLPAADLVIDDVAIVDVVAGAVEEGRTVAIADGRIRSIVPAEEGAPPAARVVDGSGRFLIPGLWDAHVHFRGGEELREENRALLPLYVANGVTTVRDAGGDLTPALLAWRDSIASGAMVGPRILTSGPKLDGPTGGWEGSIRPTSPEEVPAALDSLDALGTDYVKIYDGTTSRDVYLAIVREAERRDRIVSGHMPFSVGFLEAVDAGLDITDHLYYAFKGTVANEDSLTAAIRAGEGPGFWGALWLMMEARDSAKAGAVYEAMAEAGTAAVPTLHIGHVLAWVDEEDHGSDPELRYIAPAIEETYQGRVRSARRASDASRARTRALRQIFVEMVRPMHDAGVTLLAGSDAGPFNSYVYPGFSLHDELQALVDAGLTPAQALRTATVNPARVMRRDDELGRVAEGYLADLVLLEANPLEAISATRAIDRVIVRGEEVYDEARLRALLEGVAREDR